jgi:hypothetical protein
MPEERSHVVFNSDDSFFIGQESLQEQRVLLAESG